MAETPNLTQFFGGGPVAPPDGQSTDPALDFSIPSPWENPDAWDQVVFTLKSDPSVVFAIPPLGMGHVKLKTPVKVTIDPKGGAGTAKPKISKTGGKETKDKLEINAIDEAWPYIAAAALKMRPGSGPWVASHPKFTFADMHEIMVEEWSDAPEEDAHGFIKWELKYTEVKPGAQSGAGGGNSTSTPDAKDTHATFVANQFGNHFAAASKP